MNGVLTTAALAFPDLQKFKKGSKRYAGAYPTIPGRWIGLYENLASAIRKEGTLEVEAKQSRDVLRVIELARESHETSRTVSWS